MRILITGTSGQLGHALIASVPPTHRVQATTRATLDIAERAAVLAAVDSYRPDLIINLAGYTAVDTAEKEPEAAAAVNTLGPRYLAEAAYSLAGCRLVHVSSDYVFDGLGVRPYRTYDKPNPMSVYGKSKRLGEIAVLEILGSRATVLRTAWLYSGCGRNFLLTMLQRMRDGSAIRVVADQTGTPTAAASVAQLLWRLPGLPHVNGVLHWTDAGATTWYGFASAIADEAYAMDLLTSHPKVTPITTAQYPTPAQRPRYSVLDTSDTATQVRMIPVPWRDSLRVTLRSLQQ